MSYIGTDVINYLKEVGNSVEKSVTDRREGKSGGHLYLSIDKNSGQIGIGDKQNAASFAEITELVSKCLSPESQLDEIQKTIILEAYEKITLGYEAENKISQLFTGVASERKLNDESISLTSEKLMQEAQSQQQRELHKHITSLVNRNLEIFEFMEQFSSIEIHNPISFGWNDAVYKDDIQADILLMKKNDLTLDELLVILKKHSDIKTTLIELSMGLPGKEQNKLYPDFVSIMLERAEKGSWKLFNNKNILHIAASIGDLNALEKALKLMSDSAPELLNAPSSKDINDSPLFMAIADNQIEAAKLLIKAGADINIEVKGKPLIFYAVANDNLEMVKLLTEQEKLNFFAKDGLKRTVLHFALENFSSYTEIIEFLVNKFHKEKMEADVYGFTIEKLLSKDNNLMRISMNEIDAKLIRYLEIHERDTSVIDLKGMCNGFAFLAQYYTAIGKQDAFYKVLEGIAKWNGEKESLQETQLTAELENLGLSGYQNLGDVMEQWTNDIVWFMHDYVQLETKEERGGVLIRENAQRFREEQLAIVQESDNALHVSVIEKTPNSQSTKEMLLEKIKIYQGKPGTVLEFGGERHVTTAQIMEGGKIYYYDSNFPFKAELFDSAEDLAQVIIATKLKMLGRPSESFMLEFQAYKFQAYDL
jgi:hypothetical protein